MKRNKKRRLEIAKTTIRALRSSDLAPVQGGGYGFTCNKYNCGNDPTIEK